MKRYYWFLLLVSVFLHPPVLAHDLGIVNLSLVEQPSTAFDYRLQLHSALPQGMVLARPKLPDHCQHLQKPYQYTMQFQFNCSSPLNNHDVITLPWNASGVLLTAHWQISEGKQTLFLKQDGQFRINLQQLSATSASAADIFTSYLMFGFTHILMGFDHLLFVLAIMLIVRAPAELIKTITSFTIAHSITLALAYLGLVDIAATPVEASIALSVAILACDAIKLHRGQITLTARFPWIIAGVFGLLHGLGFAGALSELQVPEDDIPFALLSFNIGVEFGQIVFVVAVLAVYRLITTVLERSALASPLFIRYSMSYLIGTTAMYWFFERASTLI
ncbi:HupE/UreJ family protein [Bacterioplanoides sp.]|uniref:HupE/UreJ family protein n=1 Tax=Bacterioplanoides sp. TaxID=2066072 RepID=UPI003B003107